MGIENLRPVAELFRVNRVVAKIEYFLIYFELLGFRLSGQQL